MVRTRFAPSPTGYLHIGGVRTALFNWLFARRHGGQFILRIDDTDQSRHVEQAVDKIMQGLRWLGLSWDEGPEVGGPHAPYFQAQRRERHRAAVRQLIANGWAYPDPTPADVIEKDRQAAYQAKQTYVYRGQNRDLAPTAALALFEAEQPSVRLKVPTGQTTVLADQIRGRVEWQTDLMGDFVIARAGADPLYNLASIVDDLDMQITHVIRAEEHLSNTHPQMLIAQGLGQTPPTFAHLPYVAEPGGKKKLSKRNPPPGVMVALEEYEAAGYLPAAVVNALARIGWALDDKTEVMSLETIIANFSLEKVTPSPAALDPEKIVWFQQQYMQQLPASDRVDRWAAALIERGIMNSPLTAADRDRLTQIDQACGDRLKFPSDLLTYAGFCLAPALVIDAKSLKTLQKPEAQSALPLIRARLASLTDFTVSAIEQALMEVGQQTGMGGKINHVLRAGITGQSIGPGVFDCAVLLGRERTLVHLDQAIALTKS